MNHLLAMKILNFLTKGMDEIIGIKVGIRYNDAIIGNNAECDIWHALHEDTNYMSATYYVGKVIQETNINPNNVPKTPGLTQNQYTQMKNDISYLKSCNWASNRRVTHKRWKY